MRTLEQALYDHELIVLRVVGEWWELDLTGADKAACVKALAPTLAALDLRQEMSFLPPEESAALDALIRAGGRMPVAAYSRDHGEVRLMGPGRLEREEPWLDPNSAAEGLWYRGFLYRAFDETEEGTVEFYYLPAELYGQFDRVPTPADPAPAMSTLPVAPSPATRTRAPEDAVEDMTALLAFAQQQGLPAGGAARLDPYLWNAAPARRELLLTLAWEMGLLRKTADGGRPTRAAVGWLRGGREAQLRALADGWTSSGWNDLCHTPGLACEGSGWSNDPILARTALLDALPRDEGWRTAADVIAVVRATDPDFQRPDGNYDTWYIRDTSGGDYLAGFESWDAVEGRLLRFLLTGPLHWLGMTEWATADDRVTYRLAPRALAWLDGAAAPARETAVPIIVEPDATVLVPPNADRHVRFQVARVAEATPATPGQPFRYQLTPAALIRAGEQGIAVPRVLAFLEEASGRAIPPGARRALERWAAQGAEARVEPLVVLRVREAAILETLRANPKTRPYLGEALGELTAVVRPGAWPDLCRAAAQLGLLLDATSVRRPEAPPEP